MSYAADLRRHGRSFDLVVADDSADPAVRQTCREWLRAFAKKFQVGVFYAGHEEKCQYIRRLANVGISPQLTQFALTNTLGIAGSPGANRNALLLHTLGDLVLSCDDDSVCRVGELRHGDQSIRILPFGNANMDVHFVCNRRAAVNGLHRADRNLITAHEELLGKELDEFISGNLQSTPLPVKLGGADSILSRQRHVGVTLSGVLGDPGVPNLLGFVFARGHIRKRFLDHWGLHSAPKSLDIISGVPSPVISQKAAIMMTTATGLDNRLLLPPFVPSGRGEDSLFGRLIQICDPNLYTGFVPVAVLHARQASSLCEPIWAPLRLNDLVTSILNAAPDLDGCTVRDRVKIVGQHLVACGTTSLTDFTDWVKGIAVRRITSLIAICESMLSKFHSEPEFWAQEIRQAITHLQQQLSETNLGIPADLAGTERNSQYTTLQRFLRSLGELFRAWPDILAASVTLQNSGYRIGQKLD